MSAAAGDAGSEFCNAVHAMRNSGKWQASSATLSRIFSNVLKSPEDPRYRVLKTGKPRIQQEIMQPDGALDLVMAAGFRFDAEQQVLCLPDKGSMELVAEALAALSLEPEEAVEEEGDEKEEKAQASMGEDVIQTAEPGPVDIVAWCDGQLELLAMEREAEKAEQEQMDKTKGILVSRGLAVKKLQVTGVSSGLGGRVLIQLSSMNPNVLMGAHKLGVGKAVVLTWTPEKESDTKESQASGLVWRSKENTTLTVALHEYPATVMRAPVSVAATYDDYTYRVTSHAIQDLKKNNFIGSRMVSVLFGHTKPCQSLPSETANKLAQATQEQAARLKLLKSGGSTAAPAELNSSQEIAVQHALSSSDVSCIHGPPGTGKTTVVVELIRRAVLQGNKVLAVAPSNIAVDNIVERLSIYRYLKIVRLGHPARLSEPVLEHSLDQIATQSDAMAIVRDVRQEMESLLIKISGTRDREQRAKHRSEVRDLRKELRTREREAVNQILAGADVVLTTCTGAATKKLLNVQDGFDLVVVDECAQGLEASCWIGLLQAKRCVIAGDHCQLPATMTS
eukprot:TRINITY_DN3904_c0_g7_i1.p2 TRINITY_DN3904_c0_g7~~TRINITY_DN3904_c0_g7_i1.p2  ORF type:complete len:564 (+),score=113.84 TRINITY_DN3904_c0_g7_i1:38-1729(+)